MEKQSSLRQLKLTDVGLSQASVEVQGSQPESIDIDSDRDDSVVPESPPLSDQPQPTTQLSVSPKPTTPPAPCSWAGTPLNEISFGPSTYPILPPLKSSDTHCVLFNTARTRGEPPQPYPPTFRDVWDGNHVRMPCSAKSQYPVHNTPTGSVLVQKWELVRTALSQPIANSIDFEQAVLSYNSRFCDKWNFTALHSYFRGHPERSEKFFGSTLLRIIDLVLCLPEIVTHGLPLLKKQQNYSITLSQLQIACLLANAFMCTFPRRNSVGASSEFRTYPGINFNVFFSTGAGDSKKANKIKCILHYFERFTESTPTGIVTFTRQVCSTPPEWGNSHTSFSKLHITSEGTIEGDGHGQLQVDFANKFIGGGVLRQGCVQEEIRFLICPELIIARLFTEELDENEALLVTGVEQFSYYEGYASTFKWTGGYYDHTTLDSWGRRSTCIVAIDAIHIRDKLSQFKPSLLQRELNKAFCGFMASTVSPSGRNMAVATGNWGCGAFGGDKQLKSLLQWMAASEAGRDMVYFTFGDQDHLRELSWLQSWIMANQIRVGEVWLKLTQYYSSVVEKQRKVTLYDFITKGQP